MQKTMRLRSAYWQIRLQTRLLQVERPIRRSFTQQHRLRDEVTYTKPGSREPESEPRPEPETEPPQPKASIRSKLVAGFVGGGAALAYAAYRRSDAQPIVKPKARDGFATFTLIDKEDVSSTCSIFTLKPLASRIAAGAKVNADGGIYSVQLKQPQLQIARSYTMLPPMPDEPVDTLRLLIRKEEKGEVSGYLHTLSVGSDLEIRGPYKDFAFPTNTKKVIFLAGGTGIAPALKTADALRQTADVHVLWASRHREDCAGGVSDTIIEPTLWSKVAGLWSGESKELLKERNTVVLLLDLLRRQQDAAGTLKIDYFVDEEQTQIRPSTVSTLLSSTTTEPSSDKLIFVSGPEGFINYWAGPKQFVNGKEEQGKLGGALSNMNLHGWQVVKL